MVELRNRVTGEALGQEPGLAFPGCVTLGKLPHPWETRLPTCWGVFPAVWAAAPPGAASLRLFSPRTLCSDVTAPPPTSEVTSLCPSGHQRGADTCWGPSARRVLQLPKLHHDRQEKCRPFRVTGFEFSFSLSRIHNSRFKIQLDTNPQVSQSHLGAVPKVSACT